MCARPSPPGSSYTSLWLNSTSNVYSESGTLVNMTYPAGQGSAFISPWDNPPQNATSNVGILLSGNYTVAVTTQTFVSSLTLFQVRRGEGRAGRVTNLATLRTWPLRGGRPARPAFARMLRPRPVTQCATRHKLPLRGARGGAIPALIPCARVPMSQSA